MGTHCEQSQNKLSIAPKPQKKRKQGVVSHYGLAIYSKKYLKAKEKLWKLKYFTMQKCNLKKKSSKRNQNSSQYYNSIITNLKFQRKPKYHLSKILT
jgi:hypothetical protein